MTPETTSAIAALNQALEERDAEIAALQAELAAVTTWGKRAWCLIFWDLGDYDALKRSAPATVRGEADTDAN